MSDFPDDEILRHCKEVVRSHARDQLRSLQADERRFADWLEYVLDEGLLVVGDIVGDTSIDMWEGKVNDMEKTGKVLKELCAPNRSEKAKSFVHCLYIRMLHRFAAASLEMEVKAKNGEWRLSKGGIPGFEAAASPVGHLIALGLMSPDLVWRHLTWPLFGLCPLYYEGIPYHRAVVIKKLFHIAGKTLVKGLKVKEIQDCLCILNDHKDMLNEDLQGANVEVQWSVHDNALHWSLTCEQDICKMLREHRNSIL